MKPPERSIARQLAQLAMELELIVPRERLQTLLFVEGRSKLGKVFVGFVGTQKLRNTHLPSIADLQSFLLALNLFQGNKGL